MYILTNLIVWVSSATSWVLPMLPVAPWCALPITQTGRRKRPGDFWLTGSQHFHLMQGVSESLAGRVGIVNLLGFSRRELDNQSQRIEPFLPAAETESD